jgi:gamma-glutamyltranspeptidase
MPTGYNPKPGWATSEFAVAAANPLATDAGYQIIKAGGSAVDAAIAVQMVLTLVEPQSSGIGGGAFLMHGMVHMCTPITDVKRHPPQPTKITFWMKTATRCRSAMRYAADFRPAFPEPWLC